MKSPIKTTQSPRISNGFVRFWIYPKRNDETDILDFGCVLPWDVKPAETSIFLAIFWAFVSLASCFKSIFMDIQPFSTPATPNDAVKHEKTDSETILRFQIRFQSQNFEKLENLVFLSCFDQFDELVGKRFAGFWWDILDLSMGKCSRDSRKWGPIFFRRLNSFFQVGIATGW